MFDEYLGVLATITANDRETASIAGLLAGLRQANQPVPSMIGNRSSEKWFAATRKLLARELSLDVRVYAVLVLESDLSPETTTSLLEILDSSQPAELLRAVLRSLRRRVDPEIVQRVLEAWPAASPSLKREMLDLFFARKERLTALIDAIDREDILWAELDPETQRQLEKEAPPESRSKIEAHIEKSASVDRTAVLKEYQTKVPDRGTIAKGASLFTKYCAGCHRSGEIGSKVGPELSGLLTKSRPSCSRIFSTPTSKSCRTTLPSRWSPMRESFSPV